MSRIAGSYSLKYYHADPQRGLNSEVLWEATTAESDQDDVILADGPLSDFVAAIRDRRPPRTGLQEALTIAHITDAIYASAACGRAVAVVSAMEYATCSAASS